MHSCSAWKSSPNRKPLRSTSSAPPNQAPPPSASKGRPPSRKPSSRDTTPCYRCRGAHNSDNCRFKTAKCRYCHKKGHIASACHKKQRASRGTATHNVVEQGDDPVDKYTLPIDCVTSMNTHLQPLMVTVAIQDTPVPMEVNMGATLFLMSQCTLSSLLPEAELKPSTIELRTYTGEEIRVKVSSKSRSSTDTRRRT